uniref:Uncharacterized protein n=1 Tax=Syphacia muris TaxID=451379 RepID=A0A0N5AV47_9BILA
MRLLNIVAFKLLYQRKASAVYFIALESSEEATKKDEKAVEPKKAVTPSNSTDTNLSSENATVSEVPTTPMSKLSTDVVKTTKAAGIASNGLPTTIASDQSIPQQMIKPIVQKHAEEEGPIDSKHAPLTFGNFFKSPQTASANVMDQQSRSVSSTRYYNYKPLEQVIQSLKEIRMQTYHLYVKLTKIVNHLNMYSKATDYRLEIALCVLMSS